MVVVVPSYAGADDEHRLDEVRWRILSLAVAAAHEANPVAAQAAWNRLETDVPVDGQAAAYLWYMLRYRIVDYLGRRPTEQDLIRLARRQHPRYSRVLRGDISELEDMLRSLFNMISPDRRITGGRFVVLGIVTLAIFLEDPYTQLDEIKPHLADWWQCRGWKVEHEARQVRDPS